MIAAVILVVVVLLLVATPWRRLSPVGRLWALAACLNALVFFSMPTTAATSPWRPVVGRVLAASAGMSLALLLLGLVLRQRQAMPSDARAWLGPLISWSPAGWVLRVLLGNRPALLSGGKPHNLRMQLTGGNSWLDTGTLCHSLAASLS